MLMEIREISNIYSALPQCGAFLKAVNDESVKHLFLKGMVASSVPVFLRQPQAVQKTARKGSRNRSRLSSYCRTMTRQATSIMTLRRFSVRTTCCSSHHPIAVP